MTTGIARASRTITRGTERQLQPLLRKTAMCAALAMTSAAPYYASAGRSTAITKSAAMQQLSCATAPAVPKPYLIPIGAYPMPVGINSPGIAYNCGGRKVLLPVETGQITGLARITDMHVSKGMKYGTVSPITGYHRASLQLNAVLSSRSANSLCFYFVQSVLMFNTSTSRVSFATQASKELLMASSSAGAYAPARGSALEACNDAPFSGSGSVLKSNPGIYQTPVSRQRIYRVPISVSMTDSISGNTLYMGYSINGRNASLQSLKLPEASGMELITMGQTSSLKRFCACSYPVTASLVFGGASHGATAVFDRMRADLGLFYKTSSDSTEPFTFLMAKDAAMASTSEGALGITMRMHGSNAGVGITKGSYVQAYHSLDASAFSDLLHGS